MNLRSELEVATTQSKLAMLESRYNILGREVGGDELLRSATMRSLKRTINQLKEEIARYRENLLHLRRELSAMQMSAHHSRARLFIREEHLHAAQAWCEANRSTR